MVISCLDISIPLSRGSWIVEIAWSGCCRPRLSCFILSLPFLLFPKGQNEQNKNFSNYLAFSFLPSRDCVALLVLIFKKAYSIQNAVCLTLTDFLQFRKISVENFKHLQHSQNSIMNILVPISFDNDQYSAILFNLYLHPTLHLHSIIFKVNYRQTGINFMGSLN